MYTTVIIGGTDEIGAETAGYMLETSPTACIALVDLGAFSLPAALQPYADRVACYSCDSQDESEVGAVAAAIRSDLPSAIGLLTLSQSLRWFPNLADRERHRRLTHAHLQVTRLWSSALPELSGGKPAVVLNVCAPPSHLSVATRPAFEASRAAIASQTRRLAEELAPRQVRVNSVSWHSTPALAVHADGHQRHLRVRTAHGGWPASVHIKAKTIPAAMAFMLSAAPPDISGRLVEFQHESSSPIAAVV